jgi:hypothetical protein
MGAKELYEKYKLIKDAREYYKLVNGMVDDETRSGSALKFAIKVAGKVSDKVLGVSVTGHPYFTYHKMHIEVLSRALNASAALEAGREALSTAITAADGSAQLSSQSAAVITTARGLNVVFVMLLKESLDILAIPALGAHIYMQTHGLGMTPSELRKGIEPSVIGWRNDWAKVTDRALQLLTMVMVETRVAEAAVAVYDKKLAALESKKEGIGGSLGTIGAYRLREDKMWEEFERMKTPSTTKPVQAASDPGAFARKQLSKVDAVCKAVMIGCNAAMSDAVYTNPTQTATDLSRCDNALVATLSL